MPITTIKIDRKEDIVAKVGGPALYDTIVSRFCTRIRDDPKLSKFFGNFEENSLRMLQNSILDTSFLQVGSKDRVAAESRIMLYHCRLFQIGFGERQFDRILRHLVEALRVARVDEDVVIAISSHYEPMRKVFGGSETSSPKYPSKPADTSIVGRTSVQKKSKDDDQLQKTDNTKSTFRRVLSGNNLFGVFGKSKSKQNLVDMQ